MGKTGVGTKREDCETLLDGVGLPATPLSRFYFIFVYVFFYPTKKKREEKLEVWGEGNGKMYKMGNGRFQFGSPHLTG